MDNFSAHLPVLSNILTLLHYTPYKQTNTVEALTVTRILRSFRRLRRSELRPSAETRVQALQPLFLRTLNEL